MPAHFASDGVATRFESRVEFAGTMGAITSALGLLFLGARSVIPRLPASAINMPSVRAHRYWTSAERRTILDRMVSEDIERIGIATMALLLGVVVCSVAGASSGRLPVAVLVTLTAAYMIVLFAYVWWMVARRYRVPE